MVGSLVVEEPPQYRSPRKTKTKKDDGRTAHHDAELRHSNCSSEPSQGNRIVLWSAEAINMRSPGARKEHYA